MTTQDSDEDRRSPAEQNAAGKRRTALLLLALLVLAVRGASVRAQYADLHDDPDGYAMIAETLVEYGTYGRMAAPGEPVATAFRPPLYPLILASLSWDGLVCPWRIALLHLLLATGTALMLTTLAWRCGLGTWSGWLAGALVAVDPLLLRSTALVMTETLAVFMVVAVLLALHQLVQHPTVTSAIVAGWAGGLAALTRPVFLPWLALCLLVLPFLCKPGKSRFLPALVVGTTLTLVLAPWVVRNALVFGRPVVATSHGGYTLLLANNRFFYDFLEEREPGQTWDAEELHRWPAFPRASGGRPTPSDEWTTDRRAYRLAVDEIREHRAGFAKATLYRLRRLWSPFPLPAATEGQPRWVRPAVAAWNGLVLFAAVVGAVILGRGVCRSPWCWAAALLLVVTLIHAVFWSNLRMRAPCVPVLSLLASLAVQATFTGTARAAAAIRSRSRA